MSPFYVHLNLNLRHGTCSQIGLGANVTLETITVPTEVILWRSTSGTVKSKCVDIFAGKHRTPEFARLPIDTNSFNGSQGAI